MGLSQSQLAASLEVSRGACGQWEQGVSLPSVSHMAELARITEVSFEWLATGRGRVAPPSEPKNAKAGSEEDGLVTEFAGRTLSGELREVVIWLQKLPKTEQKQVIKMLRSMRNLMSA
ncbi:MAG: helix-turn-helix domain-containing protein [Gammaproteobacteria bacterium SHHR-1]|nr:helix-turn-helix domain-containing protein [gamma proteobacterium SS-5]